MAANSYHEEGDNKVENYYEKRFLEDGNQNNSVSYDKCKNALVLRNVCKIQSYFIYLIFLTRLCKCQPRPVVPKGSGLSLG